MATLKDLLASGMSRDEINALLSQGTVGTEGFQQSGFMGGEPYMPPPQAEPQQPPRFAVGEDGLSRMTDRPGEVEQAPMNTIRNNSTGVVTQMPSSSQRSHDVWADGPQEIGRYQLANGTTEIIRKIPVMRDGRQSVGMERLIETPDYLNPVKFKQLEYQKREAEVRNLNAPSMSAEDKAYQEARGRNRAEAEASRMPGTKEYLAGQEEINRKNKLNSIIQENAETALESAKIAKPKIGYFSTGLPGQILSNVGGTDAKDLEEALRPIKALTGFDKLQELREMSKTGGALGQVAVEELRFLQSVKGSLDTAQSEQQFRQILSNVEKYYEGKRNIGTAARSPVSGAESQAMLMQEAQRAIAAGAPRDAVMQRLQEKMRGQ